jgi:hypothetical protein
VSRRSGGTRGSENAASVSLRGPRGNEEQRGTFPWGAPSGTGQTQSDVVSGTLAPQLGSGTAGRLGYCGIASSGRLLDRESAVRCPESQRERE